MVDEIWVHYYTSEGKEQLKHWSVAWEMVLKKAKTILPACKIMTSALGSAHGVIFIHYLKKGNASIVNT